jgi:hypothetical protein
MSELYPAPSYAATIWTTGDTIHLALPAQYGEDKGHSVVFPNSSAGWMAISMILRDRERAERTNRRVGTAGAPVQYDLDKVLKQLTAGKPVTKVPSARKVKAEDDLTLEDLGL